MPIISENHFNLRIQFTSDKIQSRGIKILIGEKNADQMPKLPQTICTRKRRNPSGARTSDQREP